MKSKWIPVARDMDYRTEERNFGKLIFKSQYKRLKKIVKSLSWSQHCGHEWDCCGCCCAQSASITFRDGCGIITLTQHYNY